MPPRSHGAPADPSARCPDTPGLYGDARVYDVLHAPGTAGEVDALERIASRHVSTPDPGGRWLEPACGSGRCVRLAAKRGICAHGFDLDGGMVAYANDRFRALGLGDKARAVVADMRSCVSDGAIERGSYDFVFNTINSFRHLMSDRDALAHMEQIASALRPGGVYAVGVSTCVYDAEFPTEDVWEAARGNLGVTQTVQYLPPEGGETGARTERVLSHLEISRPSGSEHRDSAYELRTYSTEQWLDLIARSALSLVGVADDGGTPCEPGPSGYRLYALTRGA